MHRTRIIIASTLFLLLGLQVLSQRMPLFIGLEAGAGGGWSVAGFGLQATARSGGNEIGIGFHRSNRYSNGGHLFYRRLFFQNSKTIAPYFEVYSGNTNRLHMIFDTEWHGATVIGLFAGLGVRYRVWHDLSIYGTIGLGQSKMFARPPYNFTWSVPTGYLSVGARYEFPLRERPESIAPLIEPSQGLQFELGVRYRIVPFGHHTAPNGMLSSLIATASIRASRVLNPTLYFQFGNKYGQDGSLPNSFGLQGFGIGLRCQLIQRNRWMLESEASYIRVPHPSVYMLDSRLWIGNSISYKLHERLAATASLGMTFNKYGSPPDCMAGIRWKFGKLSLTRQAN